MGKRDKLTKQEGIWIPHAELAVAPGHSFYKQLNELLEGEQVRSVLSRAYVIL